MRLLRPDAIHPLLHKHNSHANIPSRPSNETQGIAWTCDRLWQWKVLIPVPAISIRFTDIKHLGWTFHTPWFAVRYCFSVGTVVHADGTSVVIILSHTRINKRVWWRAYPCVLIDFGSSCWRYSSDWRDFLLSPARFPLCKRKESFEWSSHSVISVLQARVSKHWKLC